MSQSRRLHKLEQQLAAQAASATSWTQWAEHCFAYYCSTRDADAAAYLRGEIADDEDLDRKFVAVSQALSAFAHTQWRDFPPGAEERFARLYSPAGGKNELDEPV